MNVGPKLSAEVEIFHYISENVELLGALKGNSRDLKVITGSVLGGP